MANRHFGKLANVWMESQFDSDWVAPDLKGAAAHALKRIDREYADWKAGLDTRDQASAAERVGRVERDLIWEFAQVSLMRDLYRTTQLDRLRTRRPSTSRRRH
jgi:hypothetical protein